VSEHLLVTPCDASWPKFFADEALRLREELRDIALRIDHIGSTAVPELDAKSTIADLGHKPPANDTYRPQIELCGSLWRKDNPELTKQYFRERSGQRRTHLHVRRAGTFSEQFPLLSRDHLRGHRGWANAYTDPKQQLAPLLLTDRRAYVEAKTPFVWDTIHLADDWAQSVG
jgi:GrpB-like predicted nucleotidyltransferase (UPF0157 family)